MSSNEYIDKYMRRKEEENILRSKVEEKNTKALDPLIAFTQGKMALLSGLRSWWLWLWTVGVDDPPCKDLQEIAEFKVMTLEWDMSADVASADVFHDPDRERNQKILYQGGGQDMTGLDDL